MSVSELKEQAYTCPVPKLQLVLLCVIPKLQLVLLCPVPIQHIIYARHVTKLISAGSQKTTYYRCIYLYLSNTYTYVQYIN